MVDLPEQFAVELNQLRTKIYEDLLQVMIQGLQDNKVDVDQSKQMAQFVVYNLDAIKTKEDVTHFLDELPKKWELYKNVCVQLKYTEQEKEDKKKLEDIQSKLHNYIN